MSNTTVEAWKPVGWVSSPSDRGTIDILWACGVTMLLCTWTVLCVNISPPNSTIWYLIRRKIWLALLCWAGPEFLLYLSVHQWQSARRSVKEFRSLNLEGWSLKHAFFADMGGYLIRTRDGAQFPLTSRHLYYLIAKGHIKKTQVEVDIIVDKKIIEDKNKTDAIIRTITIIQTLWFVINCVARAIQRLAVTTIELTVCAFITTTVPVVYFWFHKPADISSAFVVACDATIEEIRASAGISQTEEWYRTPLSFLDPPESWMSLGWTYFVNILRSMVPSQLVKAPDYRGKLIDNIPDDHFGDMTPGPTLVIQGFVTAACFAINIAAWNFWFPTTTERTLWRVCSIIMASSIYWGAFVNMYITPALSKAQIIDWLELRLTGYIDRVWKGRAKLAESLRNNHPDKDPAFTVPLRVIVPGSFIAALYCLARASLLMEDLVVLRLQPPSTYETVNWSSFVPHV